MDEQLLWRFTDRETNSIRELRCAQCGERAELFRISDVVWEATRLPTDGLKSWTCIACVQVALKRQLTAADLAPFPWYGKDCPEYYRGMCDGMHSAVTSSLAMWSKYRVGRRLGALLEMSSSEADVADYLRRCNESHDIPDGLHRTPTTAATPYPRSTQTD